MADHEDRGALQRKAVAWARVRRGLTVLGMAAISIAIPLATLVLFARIARSLLALPQRFAAGPTARHCGAL